MDTSSLFPVGETSLFGDMNGALVVILIVWSLIWKGLALWRAARRGEKIWYVALLILNTIGILEIIYYFLIAKTDKVEKK
ncbi:MAG: DUF5652 family protein [Patescibacteria group bacterium]|jgi:hypothetical protein